MTPNAWKPEGFHEFLLRNSVTKKETNHNTKRHYCYEDDYCGWPAHKECKEKAPEDFTETDVARHFLFVAEISGLHDEAVFFEFHIITFVEELS